ncbi:nitroreductase family protein, partial [Acinetobacter baumannii]|nr:nitroreductase family protein [Acinetobacter baumannii]
PEPVAPIRAVDTGIAAQTMLLAATQAGYGGCMIKSFGPGLAQALGLPEGMAPQLVLALGKPGEKIVLDEADDEHGVAYWRDADGTH